MNELWFDTIYLFIYFVSSINCSRDFSDWCSEPLRGVDLASELVAAMWIYCLSVINVFNINVGKYYRIYI